MYKGFRNLSIKKQRFLFGPYLKKYIFQMNLSITLALTDFEQHQDKEEDRMDIDVHSFIALDLLKNINVSGRIETEASLELIFKGKKDLIYFILIYSSFLLFFNLHGNLKIFFFYLINIIILNVCYLVKN